MQNQMSLTVTQVNMYIKSLIDGNPMLTRIVVEGEISNFKSYYSSGHLYFSLKDEGGTLACVMFKSSASSLKFVPEDGMKVYVTGRISVFERDGRYQLYAEKMEPAGNGALAIAFEQLKKKLTAEGLFDESRKRALPEFPKRVGVITSEYGAAVRDIFNVLGRRYPLAEVVFCPAVVQGATAPMSIVNAIKKMNAIGNIDVLIVGRGGGSAEDLWCFNDELVVRAVAGSKIPVISAVGHETDFTLCDFAADLRAPTPSAGAELAVPDIEELRGSMDVLLSRLKKSIAGIYTNERLRLEQMSVIAGPGGAKIFLSRQESLIGQLGMRLDYSLEKLIISNDNSLKNLITRLDSASPLKNMLRGYSAVTSGDRAVTSVKDVKQGDILSIRVSDGKIECEALEIYGC